MPQIQAAQLAAQVRSLEWTCSGCSGTVPLPTLPTSVRMGTWRRLFWGHCGILLEAWADVRSEVPVIEEAFEQHVCSGGRMIDVLVVFLILGAAH